MLDLLLKIVYAKVGNRSSTLKHTHARTHTLSQ